MRPIDRKLKYQIDKLIRMAKTGIAGECAVFCHFDRHVKR